MLRDTVLINAAIQQGLFDTELMASTQRKARREQRDLLTALAFASRLPVSAFYRAYGALHQVPFISGKRIQASAALMRKLPRNLVERKLIIAMEPLAGDSDERIRLVMADPEDQASIQQVKRLLGKPVVIFLAEPSVLTPLIKHANQRPTPGIDTGKPQQDDVAAFDPVFALNSIFDEAYLQRASDIHMEPLKESVQIRLRVDGGLQEYPTPFSLKEGLSMMSRLKVIASLDISEQRMPQDGSLTHTVADGTEFDVRVATIPTRFGERATMRLLGSDEDALSLKQIGMSAGDEQRFTAAINKPYGMILITGPTGSGKSTTLYSSLQEIAGDDINILTAEDPVEYVMEGISQVQVNNKVTFADALRSFLRHDPDVIMVGEIRDGETAQIALKAAMTGHLVFSTLHTNSALGVISRLVDMGTESFLLGATLLAVIAQRLVRRLCPNCKRERDATPHECAQLGIAHNNGTKICEAVGCSACMDRGYKGRLALFETFWVDEESAELISQGASEQVLAAQAKQFYSLAKDGIAKTLQGHTSMDELARLSLLLPVVQEGEQQP